MKKIELFRADDGTIHETEQSANIRDSVYKASQRLLSLLGGAIKDKGCKFANGGGYYQLSKDAVSQFDREFVQAVKTYESWIVQKFLKGKEPLPMYGMVGRCLCDGNSPLYSAYSMRQCIDSQNRRWGQPYFAYNPNEGKQTKLGDLK